MVQTQQSETVLQFTPEEATQILSDAVNLSSNYLSLTQLEAIADEAGVPRETLYQAIQQHARQKDAASIRAIQQQERRRKAKARLKKWLWATAFGAVIALAFKIGYESGNSIANQSGIAGERISYHRVELEKLSGYLEQFAIQRLQGRGATYYVMPQAFSIAHGLEMSSLWQLEKNGSARLLFKTRGRLERACLSEDEKFLAMWVADSNDAGVWVMDLKSGERHRILGDSYTEGYRLLVEGDYVQAYGGEIAWVDKRKLLFSTTHGRYMCTVNERGAPLTYSPYDTKP